MHKVYVSIPFIGMNANGESTRDWAHMTFSSATPVDKRRVKREIHKWGRRELQRHVHSEEVRMILKHKLSRAET